MADYLSLIIFDYHFNNAAAHSIQTFSNFFSDRICVIALIFQQSRTEFQ